MIEKILLALWCIAVVLLGVIVFAWVLNGLDSNKREYDTPSIACIDGVE